MKNQITIEPKKLYRMPWSKTDNASSYLEITRKCNITCEYCPQNNIPLSDKSFSQIKFELDELLTIRKSDVIPIAASRNQTVGVNLVWNII